VDRGWLRWIPGRSLSRRRWLIFGVVAALVAIGGSGLVLLTRQPSIQVTNQLVLGTPEADRKPVSIDTTLYLPAHTPAPAVLLAHGLGGTKRDLDAQARGLARHGYIVLAYTARGFGSSGGLIHLDSVKYEVADATKLIDFLQARPEVLTRNGQPVVGVAGSSYGGALALMLGATDHRIGAVAADITWNDLGRSLLPNAASVNGAVFKKLWAGYLFSTAEGQPGTVHGPPGCGRFAADVCQLYQRIARGGITNAAGQTVDTSLLLDSSPATFLQGMRAPTLLTQGEQDSLFTLREADSNAKQIAAAGAQVQVRWRSGGHDAPNEPDDVAGWQRAFFDRQLRGKQTGSTAQFELNQRGAGISSTNGRRIDTILKADGGYPDVNGNKTWQANTLPLHGKEQTINAPAGGTPAAVSTIPALGELLSTGASLGLNSVNSLSQLPGQTAMFTTDPLSESTLIVGSPRVALGFTSQTDITAFVSVRDLGPDGSSSMPTRLVSPIHVASDGQPALVDLPWMVARIPAGHRLAVVVSTTDFGYAMPTDARSYTVRPVDGFGGLTVRTLPVTEIRSGGTQRWVIAAGLVVLVCLGFAWWRLRSRRPSDRDESLADVPIVVSGLVKEYADGYRAVDGVTFRVERGQVLGLLGPNGAGKTTTLRVLMGLILPTEGSIRVFGEEVVPGSPALSMLGAFVEGPGFLPHLTGDENLRLYWAASGRTADAAQFDAVLEIAGLGPSLFRKVKTYSHGMQQRLAIAQAMLGLPDVLVLDEPTNGLDPPQIAEMREVLHRYAETGRTVIVSSHLLAEVEQTCTHVVVMHRGRLVAAGSVAEVAGSGGVQLVVDDPAKAAEILAAAGISTRSVPARRALEDVFLDLIGERHD
jgi:ABC-2 type transport system ATP-binding protein